jgi:phospholipid/cholesterol/gamma-HCH transport system substrate-binding protein
VKISKEAKIGLLTVISAAILYFGFRYLRGIEMFRKVNIYYVVYDKLDQIKVSSNIVINGLKVGRVSQTQLLQDQDSKILVELEVNSGIVLTKNTVARQVSLDLVNPKVIQLEIGAGEKASSGDTIVGGFESSLMQTLEAKAQPFIQQLDSLGKFVMSFGVLRDRMVELSEVLGARGQDLAPLLRKTSTLLDSTTALISSAKKTSEATRPLMSKYGALADTLSALKLSQTIEESRKLLAELRNTTSQINSGQGTLGKMIKDETLYRNLNQTLSDLDKVLVEFQENPNKYLAPLGKKPKKKK